MFKSIKYTDGIKFIGTDHNWLVTDILVILQLKLKNQDFVAIKVSPSSKKISYEDGNDNILFKQKYAMMDVDCDITLFYTNGVLMLASEY